MQKCRVKREVVFTIDFDDSEDARLFYNRAFDPFSFSGYLELCGQEVVATPNDVGSFEKFIKDNLDEIGINERGLKIYQLYKSYQPDKEPVGENHNG